MCIIRWHQRYLESIRLVCASWGWDVVRERRMANGGQYTFNDVRLAKMIRCTWLFEERQYMQSLQRFAHELQANEKQGRSFKYGCIVLDEILYMTLPRARGVEVERRARDQGRVVGSDSDGAGCNAAPPGDSDVDSAGARDPDSHDRDWEAECEDEATSSANLTKSSSMTACSSHATLTISSQDQTSSSDSITCSPIELNALSMPSGM